MMRRLWPGGTIAFRDGGRGPPTIGPSKRLMWLMHERRPDARTGKRSPLLSAANIFTILRQNIVLALGIKALSWFLTSGRQCHDVDGGCLLDMGTSLIVNRQIGLRLPSQTQG